jgi:quercetin dioxygenase-like cupin family protein
MSDAASHFSTTAGGEPAGPGRYVRTGDIKPAELVPGLEFRPVLGDKGMANFVHFEPNTEAPRHVHEEEQIVVVLEGEFTFDIDGEKRVMRKGDVAVVPSWVPHGAWTTDSQCLEVDFFSPPRTTLVALAQQQLGAGATAAPTPDAEA